MTLTQYLERNRLARQFESLGDNAEFGMLQHAWGVDSSNLFRFAYCTSLPALIGILQRRFADLFVFENLLPFGGGGMVLDRANGIAFNSDMRSTQEGRRWVFSGRRQQRLETYLAEVQKVTHQILQTRRKLEQASRIFVFKQNAGTSPAEAVALHDALLAYGPVHLLVVNQAQGATAEGAAATGAAATGTGATGSARLLRPGLYLGQVERLAPYERAGYINEASWFQLLAAVAAMAGLPAEEPPPAGSLCQALERGMDDPTMLEGLNPAAFTLGNYRRLYPDLASLGGGEALFRHYAAWGYFEGRQWQGGEDEAACVPQPLDALDQLYRLNLHDKAHALLAGHLADLAGYYRSFSIALALGAQPATLLACYQGIRQRPGFAAFLASHHALCARFYSRVPHADFADFVLARQAADGLAGWPPGMLRASLARHLASFPEAAERLAGLAAA